MKHFYLGLSTSTLKLRYFFGLLVLSRGVWTILWEMMSRLKEKYMCVLFYACILQKLVGHWAMQIVIVNKHLVSEFREFYWTWVWRALTLQFAQSLLDCQFQWENSFHQITWHRLVQSLCNFCPFGSFLAYFGQNMLCFFKGEFFSLEGKFWNLQGLISTTRGTFEPKTHSGSHL